MLAIITLIIGAGASWSVARRLCSPSCRKGGYAWTPELEQDAYDRGRRRGAPAGGTLDGMTDDRVDVGALARAQALACEVPAWSEVVRVTYGEDGVRFEYGDRRPAYSLPGIVEVG